MITIHQRHRQTDRRHAIALQALGGGAINSITVIVGILTVAIFLFRFVLAFLTVDIIIL